MPRPGPAMPLVSLRLPAELLAAVDGLAAATEAERSETVRTLLTEALRARTGPHA